MLTSKEMSLIDDLIGGEALVCKKAKLYSRITTNQKLAEELKELSQRSFKRVENLLSIF